MRTLVIFAAILGFLTGCSSENKNAIIVGQRIVKTFESQVEALNFVSQSAVECEGNCPDSVGSFFMYHTMNEGNTVKHGVGFCSVTLIGPKKVLTNRHCIEGIFKAGDKCNGDGSQGKPNITFKFPASGAHPFAEAKCKKVLKTSGDHFFTDANGSKYRSRQAPDWAVLELEQPVGQRKGTATSTEKVLDNSVVDLYPTFFLGDYEVLDKATHKGIIKHVECRRKFAAISPYGLDEYGSMLNLVDCTKSLPGGTSGSGMFSRGTGQVVGVHAAGIGNNSSGTSALCFDEDNGPNSVCTYSEDPQYVEIMSVYGLLRFGIRDNVIKHTQQFFDYGYESGEFRWNSSELSEEAFRRINVQWNAPWSHYFDFLAQSADTHTARRMQFYLLQAAIPRTPECVNSSTVKAQMDVPLINLETWDLPSQVQYVQQFAGYQEGRELVSSGFDPFNSPGFNRYPLPFKATTQGSTVVLESTGENSHNMFPSPFQKLTISVPFCQ